jgi:hypothetical protein
LTIFENLRSPEALNAAKASDFKLSASALHAVFIDNETLAIVSPGNTLLFYNMGGMAITCASPLQMRSKTLLCIGQTKDVLYTGCMSTIQRLKLKRKNNSISVTCEEELDVKQGFEAFSVDDEQNRIIIASNTGITIFTLSPTLSLAHTIAFQTPVTPLIMAVSRSHDRFAIATGNEVVCYSITGEEFRYQHTDMKNPKCLVFDPKDNIYVIYSKRQGCSNYRRTHSPRASCDNCGYSAEQHHENGRVFQIFHDGSGGRYLLSTCLLTRFVPFNQNFEKILLSDGQKCTLYNLGVSSVT